MESAIIRGVTYTTDEAKVTVRAVPDRPGVAAHVFARAGRRQHQRRHDHPERRRAGAQRHLAAPSPPTTCRRPTRRSRSSSPSSGAEGYSTDDDIAKVSVVGAGMRTNPGVAAKMFQHAGRPGHQPGDDQHLADQDRLRDRQGAGRTRPCARCTTRSSWRRSRSRTRKPTADWPMPERLCRRPIPSPSPAPPASSAAPCARILEERGFPVGELRLLASERSRGRRLPFRGERGRGAELYRRLVRRRRPGVLRRRRRGQHGVRAGRRRRRRDRHRQVERLSARTRRCRWSCRRSTPTPWTHTRASSPRPTARTIQMVVALKPIYDAAGIERVVVSTYQAVSRQRQERRGRAARSRPRRRSPASPCSAEFYPHQIAFNAAAAHRQLPAHGLHRARSRRWWTRRRRSSPTRDSR